RKDGYRFRTEPPAESLDPYYEGGGITEVIAVPMGAGGKLAVLLNRYVHIARPGPYTLHCELDLKVTDTVTKDEQPCRIRTSLALQVRRDELRRREVLDALRADVLGPDPGERLRAADELSELRSAAAVPVLARALEVSSD